MSDITPSEKEISKKKSGISRKSFFRHAGISAAAAVAVGLYGCEDSPVETTTEPGKGIENNSGPNSDKVNLGSGDIGVLNYAYALEQLEAAFYTQVLDNAYSDMSGEEGTILEDLRSHEVAHRDFYDALLGSDAIPGLEVDFSSIDFSSRSSVLETARTFEDLGVSAYNGAGQLLQDPENLLQAGKIVSVEARHAAAIRDLLDPNSASFAGDDIIDENGLGVINSPGEVLSAAGPFIVNEIDASNLPQA